MKELDKTLEEQYNTIQIRLVMSDSLWPRGL